MLRTYLSVILSIASVLSVAQLPGLAADKDIQVKSASLRPFLESTLRQIKQNWSPKHAITVIRCPVIGAHINSNGTMDKLRLARSTGKANLDQPALNAVKKINQLESLPREFTSGIDIAITFSGNGPTITCNN
jgi:TonB family protein